MITNHQIKKEIFTLIRKGPYEPAPDDTVNVTALKKVLFGKYAYDLSDEEFNNIADDLVDSGDFHWDNNGKLALTSGGVANLERAR